MEQRDRLIAMLSAVLDRLPNRSAPWQCPACALTNMRSRLQCEACHTVRPERPAGGSYKDEASYLSRPILNEAQQRLICGLPAVSLLPTDSSELATGEPWALARLRDDLFSGSRAEVALKVAVLPLVVPIVLAAGMAYFAVTRTYRLLRYVCVRLPTFVAYLLRTLYAALSLLAAAITAVCRAAVALVTHLKSCWHAVLDFLARHCKSFLFALYDIVVAPLFTAVDRCVHQPLKAAATGCARVTYDRVLLPLIVALISGLDACLPMASRALKTGCGALGTVAYEVDCALTEGVIYAATGLWNALHAFGGIIGRATSWVWTQMIDVCRWLQRIVVAGWDIVAGACRWLWSAVLRPLCETIAECFGALGRALDALGGIIGRAASWVWTQVLAPLGSAAWGGVTALGSAIGSAFVWLFEHIGRALDTLVGIIGRATSWVWTQVLAPLGSAAWGGVTALGSAIGSAFVWLFERIVWPMCVAVGRASVEVAHRAVAMCSALAGLVGTCCSALGQAFGTMFTVIVLPLGSWIAATAQGAIAMMEAMMAPLAAAAAAAAAFLGALVAAVVGALGATARAVSELLFAVYEALLRCVGAADGAQAGSRQPAMNLV